MLGGTCKGSLDIGIPEILSVFDFSTSFMQNFERSFATSATFCVELSEYKTQGLQPKQALVPHRSRKNKSGNSKKSLKAE